MRIRSWNDLRQMLVTIDAAPPAVALGFAIGAFWSITPFFGLHTLGALAMCFMLRANKIAAVVGVWVINPLNAPIAFGLSYWVGATLLGVDLSIGQHLDFSKSALAALVKQAPDLFWALAVGGMVVGLPLALACYGFAHAAVSRYRRITQKDEGPPKG